MYSVSQKSSTCNSIPGCGFCDVIPYTEFIYYNDPTNRIKEKIFPDGSSIEYFYGINDDKPTITIKDENNQYSRYTYDLLGNLLKVEQGPGYSIVFTYEYDVLGNLIEIRDPYDKVITQEYDGLNRQLLNIHPDIGTTILSYYGPIIREPTTREDGKNQVTDYIYDDLNRIKKIIYE